MSRSRSFLRQQSAASPASGAWPVLLMGNERLRSDRCICFWLNEPQKKGANLRDMKYLFAPSALGPNAMNQGAKIEQRTAHSASCIHSACLAPFASAGRFANRFWSRRQIQRVWLGLALHAHALEQAWGLLPLFTPARQAKRPQDNAFAKRGHMEKN